MSKFLQARELEGEKGTDQLNLSEDFENAGAAVVSDSSRQTAAITLSERPSARGKDQGWIQDMVKHVFPAFEQHDSKRAAKLVEVFFAGGKFFVSEPLIEPIGEL